MSGTKSHLKAAFKPDAIDLLMDDHKRVKKLFKEFDKACKKGSQIGKVEIARQICDELIAHTLIEEEIFYPAARAAILDEDLLNEAQVEHASAKELIEQIQAMDGTEDLFEAKVTVLGEHIDHHVMQEEKEMFSKARKSKMNLNALALDMLTRKEDLTVELA